jgi:hypothetical protein
MKKANGTVFSLHFKFHQMITNGKTHFYSVSLWNKVPISYFANLDTRQNGSFSMSISDGIISNIGRW